MKLISHLSFLCGMLIAGCTTSAFVDNMPQKTIVLMAELGTSQQLQKFILEHENVVIFFYGEQCSPCNRFKPLFRAVANSDEFANKVTFIEVSAVQYESARYLYGVKKWPTVIYFKNGREVRRDVRRDDPNLSFISAEIFKEHVQELVDKI